MYGGGSQKATCREKMQASMEVVWLKNRGNRDIAFRFDGQDYLIQAGTQKQVAARIAWLVLGDPDLRPGMRNKPTFGTPLTWSKEVERLMHKYGAWAWNPDFNNGVHMPSGRHEFDKNSEWEYVINGKSNDGLTGAFYCPQFGRGAEYYTTQDKIYRPSVISYEPVTADGEVQVNKVSRSSVVTSHQGLTDDDSDGMPAGRQPAAAAA